MKRSFSKKLFASTYTCWVKAKNSADYGRTIMETEILDYTEDAQGFAQLKLARPESFEYRPGQYVQYTDAPGAKVKYLALASHHSEKELLLAGRLGKPASNHVTISEPQGKGFACNYADKAGFLFLTHGTGISAVRPAMLERRMFGHRNDTLLFGVRTKEDEPQLDCLSRDFGAEQLRAYSGSGDCARVQQRLETLELNRFGAVIIIGSKEMMTSCREILQARSFPGEKVYSNF